MHEVPWRALLRWLHHHPSWSRLRVGDNLQIWEIGRTLHVVLRFKDGRDDVPVVYLETVARMSGLTVDRLRNEARGALLRDLV